MCQRLVGAQTRRQPLVVAHSAGGRATTMPGLWPLRGPLIGVAVKDSDTVLRRSETVALGGGNATHDMFESTVQHVLMFKDGA
jgi:hypothetical protein